MYVFIYIKIRPFFSHDNSSQSLLNEDFDIALEIVKTLPPTI